MTTSDIPAAESGTESRSASLWPGAELRAAPEGLSFEGYAAVFDTPSVRLAFPGVNGGRPFREVIHRGAFAKTLAEAPTIRLLWQHDDRTLPLASTRNGSLALSEDDHGLRVSGTLPDDEWGRPVRNALSDGRVGGMSFRFQKVLDRFASEPDGDVRHLLEVRLVHEVSITDSPAYPATTAGVRSAGDEPDVWLTEGELEAVRAARATAPAACCDACAGAACCGTDPAAECPDGCPGCDSCDCAADAPAAQDQTDSAPAEADHTASIAARRARLGPDPEG